MAVSIQDESMLSSTEAAFPATLKTRDMCHHFWETQPCTVSPRPQTLSWRPKIALKKNHLGFRSGVAGAACSPRRCHLQPQTLRPQSSGPFGKP